MGRISGASGCGRGKGFENALQVIWGLMRDRVSFSLCLSGFNLDGDTLKWWHTDTSDSAANVKHVPSLP